MQFSVVGLETSMMFGICQKRRLGAPYRAETPGRGFVLQLQISANASEKFRWAVSSKQAVMAFYRCTVEYY